LVRHGGRWPDFRVKDNRRAKINVGIPVWNAASFVGETLDSVLKQRDASFTIFISIDGSDLVSAKACRPFLADSRVRMTIQKQRLGWVRNSAAVLAAALADEADYACIQPHDDVLDEDYLAELLVAAESNPAAAVVYSDLLTFGYTGPECIISQPSVIGSSQERGLALLSEHYNAVAYRGLIRGSMLRKVPLISGNPFNNFAADTVWMARLARVGDLVRVPRVLYRKRYHAGNTHTRWSRWRTGYKIGAWTRHCLDMLAETLAGAPDPASRRLLHAAARERLAPETAAVGPYQALLLSMSPTRKKRMIRRFEMAAAARTDIGLLHSATCPPIGSENWLTKWLLRDYLNL
jgi:GT2 family glycosyltransferase